VWFDLKTNQGVDLRETSLEASWICWDDLLDRSASQCGVLLRLVRGLANGGGNSVEVGATGSQ
jgi:hypothetical protein